MDMITCFYCGQEHDSPITLCPDCSKIEDLEQLCDCASALQAASKQLGKQIDAVKARCREVLAEPGSHILGTYQVDWRRYERPQLNFKRLRADHPVLMDAYSDQIEIDSVFISKLAI